MPDHDDRIKKLGHLTPDDSELWTNEGMTALYEIGFRRADTPVTTVEDDLTQLADQEASAIVPTIRDEIGLPPGKVLLDGTDLGIVWLR